MTIKEYNKLMKVIKDSKCDIFVITNNIFIGSDIDMVTLTVIPLDINLPPNTFYESNKDIWKEINVPEDTEDCLYILEHFKLNRVGATPILMLYNDLMNDINNSNRVEELDMKALEDFNTAIAGKSADGLYLYRYSNKYIISIFKGLLPINKPDRVAMNIYDSNRPYFITEFIINKKSIILHKFIKYRKIT